MRHYSCIPERSYQKALRKAASNVDSQFSSIAIKRKREELSNDHEKHKIIYDQLQERLAVENLRYLDCYREYIFGMLKRIPLDYRATFVKIVEESSGAVVSVERILSLLRFRAFDPVSRQPRKHEYVDEETIAKNHIDLVFNMFKRKGGHLTLSSAKKPLIRKSGAETFRTGARTRLRFERLGLLVAAGDPSLKFHRHEVAGDGNCAYTAFGVERQQAYDLLDASLKGDKIVRDLLRPVVHEQGLEENFIDYLEGKNFAEAVTTAYREAVVSGGERSGLDFEPVRAEIDKRFTVVARAYLDYDIIEKKISAGYAHPRVLQALAHVRGIRLRMWRLNDAGKLIPHIDALNVDYSDFNSDKEECKHLLFDHNNHFDLLEIAQEAQQPKAMLIDLHPKPKPAASVGKPGVKTGVYYPQVAYFKSPVETVKRPAQAAAEYCRKKSKLDAAGNQGDDIFAYHSDDESPGRQARAGSGARR